MNVSESAASSAELAPDSVADERARHGRLRDRTDELELFLSGLLAFALLAVPGRLFELWASNTVHTEGVHFHALTFAFTTAVGMCYVLALALIAHLAVRGYWIGLIGLRSHFPAGVLWDRMKTFGPLSKAFYQRQGNGLDAAIARADRLSSLLFSTTLVCVLTLFGSLVLGVIGLAAVGTLGTVLGNVDRIAVVVMAVLVVVALSIVLVPLLLEWQAARRAVRGKDTTRQAAWLERMLALQQRLPLMRQLQTMQFILQSNLKGQAFTVFYLLAIGAAMLIGAFQIVGSMKFSLFNRYAVVTEEAVDHGMLSAHYESLRSAHDALLVYPMIPADTISSSQLRLFIPHRPQRDNALARERCTALDAGRNTAQGAKAASAAVECLAAIWSVQLDGKPVDLRAFVPMERRDLDLRGMVGYLSLVGMAPGRHDLRLVWNADGGESGPARRREYSIPFWYAPGP